MRWSNIKKENKEECLINLKNIYKEYGKKDKNVKVLNDLSITFEKGKFYAITGHSGCGKSTLLSIIGLLESITSGVYTINGINVKNLNSKEEANIRKKYIGFIFQDFYLDDYLKAYENVMFPMIINKDISKDERKQKALTLLKEVELSDRINHFPKELSGGEKQRVAIARALSNNPNIILADEPTGNLDEESENKIFEILKKLSQEGKCVIVVSHSREVKNYADIVYKLKDGKLEVEKWKW